MGKILIDNNLKIQYEPSSSVYHWHGINQSLMRQGQNQLSKF